MQKLGHFLIGLLLSAASVATWAQNSFPTKPIRMIVVYPAGGGADLLARTLGETFLKNAHQPLIVENKSGASGMIGASACKAAVPDGYTYCLVLSDVMTINPSIFRAVAYDVDRDFVPIASLTTMGTVVAVNSSLPVNNLRELAAYSRLYKGKINWGSFGIGSSSHLILAQFNTSLNGDLTHIPYQGMPQFTPALLNNEVQSGLMIYGQAAQYLEKGQIRPIAVMGNSRLPRLPDVPTVNEQGLNFTPVAWYGIFAPAGTPANIVERMNQLVNLGLDDPTVRKLLDLQGFIPAPDTQAGFKERLTRDRREWGTLAKSMQLKLD